MDWVPPESFDEYRLVKLLGRGSVAQVWLAHDTVLDRLVAVKFTAELPAHDAVRQRFLTEARAAARVQHPNMIAVYRVGEIGCRPYLISEYVQGTSLDQIAHPVAWPRLLEIAIGLARGLAAAHRQGVLHRDLKPANAVVSDNGEVKLLDFGLAELLEPVASPHTEEPPILDAATTALRVAGEPTIVPAARSEASVPPLAPDAAPGEGVLGAAPKASGNGMALPRRTPWQRRHDWTSPGTGSSVDRASSVSSTGAVMGTPAYMPPELWRGEPATPASDVYSLGALLYELAAGTPPHCGDSREAVRRSAVDTDAGPLAVAAPGIDPGFADIVDRCLLRDPARRFASGEAVREALESPVIGDKTARRVLARPRRRRLGRGPRRLVVVGAALALAIACFMERPGGRRSRPPLDVAPAGTPLPALSAQRSPDAAKLAVSAHVIEAPPGGCAESMVRVPPGTFRMGSLEGDDDEQPQHEVTLSAYCMDKTEVTVADYTKCTEAGACSAPLLTMNSTNYSAEDQQRYSRWCNRQDRPDHPINCVDWNQATAYCRWQDKRLPTEAEWEYAARGSDGRRFPWGNEPPSAKRMNGCGVECATAFKGLKTEWSKTYDDNDGWETTAPVGIYPEGMSPFGALDMAGNVGEWTADWYDVYPAHAETNPQGPKLGTSRVARGGGWFGGGRAADREWPDPTVRAIDRGFRCARGM